MFNTELMPYIFHMVDDYLCLNHNSVSKACSNFRNICKHDGLDIFLCQLVVVCAPVFKSVPVTMAAMRGTGNSTEAVTCTLVELKGMC